MFKRKVIEPERLTEQEKLEYLARMFHGSIYPTAFQYDNELTLISLLARKVVDLQEQIHESHSS
jgi:hypothetical protein